MFRYTRASSSFNLTSPTSAVRTSDSINRYNHRQPAAKPAKQRANRATNATLTAIVIESYTYTHTIAF